ncbi:MAG TPA: FkbM family methyltransferase [Thermoanaerobaculia bacterium]|nr:FkbM family methyltransferase [Thermoanaerobaculia bacterium]
MPGELSVTREHVLWGYRLFLDREPESEARVADKIAAWKSVRQLRIDFMTSQEFRDRNPDLALTNEPLVVIREISPGLRLFIDLSDQVVGMGVLRGRYETEELELVRRHVRAGDTVLDIGANIGFFTMNLAAMIGSGGKVYAFEPSPRIADLLERSVAENGFGDRVEVARAAVADQPGRLGLFLGNDSLNLSGSYLVRNEVAPDIPGRVLEVPVLQLDAEPIRRPVSFIKIDVEGAEPLALRGARNILREDRPTILAELNPSQLARVAGCNPADFLAEMEALGYACRTLGGRAVRTSQNFPEGDILSVVFAPR